MIRASRQKTVDDDSQWALNYQSNELPHIFPEMTWVLTASGDRGIFTPWDCKQKHSQWDVYFLTTQYKGGMRDYFSLLHGTQLGEYFWNNFKITSSCKSSLPHLFYRKLFLWQCTVTCKQDVFSLWAATGIYKQQAIWVGMPPPLLPKFVTFGNKWMEEQWFLEVKWGQSWNPTSQP